MEYACPCLNVRLASSPADVPPHHRALEPGYQPLFVGEHGITIVHNHLTLRTRTNRPVGYYTALSCLVCRTLIYRVASTNPGEVLSEGPVVQSDNWVHEEVLRSKDGFVECNVAACITSSDIVRAIESPQFTPRFHLRLPEPLGVVTSYSSPEVSDVAPPINPVFPTLPPMFLSPPFTPSHPVFLYLAKRANESSDALRIKAQAELEDWTRRKMEEIQAAESVVRNEVDLLWTLWKEAWQEQANVSRATTEKKAPKVEPSSTSGAGTPLAAAARTSPKPIVIDEAPQKSTSNGQAPPTSLLSVSLAQSSFHHPQESRDSNTPSPAQEPLSSPTVVEESAVLGPYRRAFDDSFAVAVSLRMASEEMQRARQISQEASAARHSSKSASRHASRDAERVNRGESRDGDVGGSGNGTTSTHAAAESAQTNGAKGSKKVKFDAGLENTDEEEVQDEEEEVDSEPALFEMEGDVTTTTETSTDTVPTTTTPPVANRKDDKAWKVLDSIQTGRRAQHRTRKGSDYSDDEEEDDTKTSAFAVSLPVALGPMSRNIKRNVVKEAYLRPKTSLADRPGILVPPLPGGVAEGGRGRQPPRTAGAPAGSPLTSESSPSQTRDRDNQSRSRSRGRVSVERSASVSFALDPWLSLAESEEEEQAGYVLEEEDEEDEAEGGDGKGRGLMHAYEILQRQRMSKVPDEGMWRSMA
ncbi:hypothetical protein BOTBODRAFT_40719 [Botryobasidium botryosum FD-172 SS1]|uniref:Uncharacterized protein n=1 Tax=Botryobasidium botryosum (strain FD-172 SS1) TaxID=930990 RepID=A0A067N8Y4_BOTB1|nr:hypothetical protein BOTBODRAFT_40719 [Botryobasidium botryosum FD-172 SS1]